MIEETNLRVAEAYHKDVGRGIARIDTRLMQQMELVSGDIIEISGKSQNLRNRLAKCRTRAGKQDPYGRKPAWQCKSRD